MNDLIARFWQWLERRRYTPAEAWKALNAAPVIRRSE